MARKLRSNGSALQRGAETNLLPCLRVGTVIRTLYIRVYTVLYEVPTYSNIREHDGSKAYSILYSISEVGGGRIEINMIKLRVSFCF